MTIGNKKPPRDGDEAKVPNERLKPQPVSDEETIVTPPGEAPPTVDFAAYLRKQVEKQRRLREDK